MDKSKEVKSRKLNIATNSVSDLTEDEEIQERPARKISLPERKISLPEYFPTSNPLVLAKSFAQIPEEDEIEREPTRKNSFPARKISFPSRNIPEYEEEESNWEPTRKNCFPDRKNSFPVRKISLPEYFPTSNPLVLAKSFSQISENEEFEDTFTEEKFRRKSHLPLPVSQPVKTRQRSHSVGVNVFDYNENHTDDIEQEDEMEFVGVKDEIMLIKGQFDKLLSVLNFKSEQSDEEKMIKDSRTITVQLFVVMGIAIGHILDGTVLAYTSTAIPSIDRDNSTFTSKDENLKPFIYSAHSFGATVACFLAGFLMSTFGRRGATLFCTIPCYMLGYIVIGLAQSYISLIVGRFLTGMGLGMTLTIPNVYIVEVTDPQYRGVLGVLPNLFCQLGIFITYVVGQFLDWSQMAFAFSALNLIFFVAVFYIPESPHFLMSKGQEEKAEAALNLLDIDLSVMATMNLEHRENTVHETFSQKLKKPENWKPFLSGIILMTFFQGTAYPIMIGNTLSMFREVSESIDEHIASTVVGIAIVVFALMAIPLAKKCERKTLLGISALGVCACLFTLGAFYYLKTYAEVDNFGWVALLDFLIYIGFFTVGFGSVSWLVFAEVLPPEIRPTAYPLGIAIMWFMNFILTTLYAPMLSQIGTYGLLWTYAGISSLGCIFIAVCLPETRNKMPFEIAAFYRKRPQIRQWIRRIQIGEPKN